MNSGGLFLLPPLGNIKVRKQHQEPSLQEGELFDFGIFGTATLEESSESSSSSNDLLDKTNGADVSGSSHGSNDNGEEGEEDDGEDSGALKFTFGKFAISDKPKSKHASEATIDIMDDIHRLGSSLLDTAASLSISPSHSPPLSELSSSPPIHSFASHHTSAPHSTHTSASHIDFTVPLQLRRNNVEYSTPLASHLRLPKINPDEIDYSKKYYYSSIQSNPLPTIPADDPNHHGTTKHHQTIQNNSSLRKPGQHRTRKVDFNSTFTSNASLTMNAHTQYYKAHTSDFQAAINKQSSARNADDVEVIFKNLKKLLAFEELNSDSKVKELCKVVSMEKFNANQPVFDQGDPADSFYIIFKGTVRMSVHSDNNENQVLATLRRGEKFGLLLSQIQQETLRTCSVTTCEPTVLLQVQKEDYDRLLKFTHEKEGAENLDFLRKSALFNCILPVSMNRWAQHALQRKYEANEVVYKRGDVTDGLYFIRSGCCKILQEVQFNVKDKQKRVQVEVCKVGGEDTDGDFFGELEFCKRLNTRQVTVIVESVASILFVPLSESDKRIPLTMMEVMKEAAKMRYPDDSRLWHLFQEKEKERQWQAYKKKLVADIVTKRKR